MMNSAADIPTVLYISGFSDIVGGGQRSFLLILKGLDQARFRPVVLCPAPGEVSREVSAMGIEARFLEQPQLRTWKLWRIISYAAALRRLIGAEGTGLVHCDTLASAFLAGLANLAGGSPVVFHARVSDSGGLMDRLIPFLCSKIICVSAATASRFACASNSKDKIRVIYNGVDTEIFSPLPPGNAFREKHNIPPHVPLLGYCGQLIEGKGLAVLIDAFRTIKSAVPEARLVMAGRGDFEPELRCQVEACKLGDYVIFAGFVENIPGFMTALDIFMFPSVFREGLSRVLLEAMACGRPVIAAPLGGNLETVVEGETGLFFQAGSAPDLARKTLSLLGDSALSVKLGENGRRRVMELFDIRGTSEKIQGLYEEILHGTAGGGLT